MTRPQRQLSIVPPADDSWNPPSRIMYESVAASERKSAEGHGWAIRHFMAWEFGDASSGQGEKRMEAIIRDSIIAWARYGEQHWVLYHSHIGKDGVLGVAFKAMGNALRDMLNGNTGRLDCGTLDKLILDIAKACDVDLEE